MALDLFAEIHVRDFAAAVTVVADGYDERVAAIKARGIEPALDETYGNGVRKTTFRDPDGNEIGFGGAPL